MTSPLEVNHRRFVDEIWYPENAPNYGVIDEVMGENIVVHTPLGDVHGRAAVKDYFKAYLAIFPKQTMETRDFVVSGNRTIVRWDQEATHDGMEFLGIEPAGKQMFVTGLTMAYWDEDKETMDEIWFSFDLLGAVNQLKPAAPEENVG
ncbi:ester cyclase [Streptomyces sp. NPDC059080]|uniref:ester cyclase n=1 Tax=Streptomyces sp. NPDC059080 TaxID=3346718 RepID=UPI003686CA99